MSDLNSSLCISSVYATALELAGIEIPEGIDSPNPVVTALAKKKLGNGKTDRTVIYNPDAVALWVYQKYTDKFIPAQLCTDFSLPMLSVMPSVTPVCFASMYTGVTPEIHGIRKYEKPVLKCRTVFDSFIENGKKCAIVSTSGDSISTIFLERNMDYFIYGTVEEVNAKALEIIGEDKYDFVVIYNGNYDGTMHRHGPEAEESLSALDGNVAFFAELCDKIESEWKNHNVFLGFCPDHGCHEIDGGCGSHGLDMEEDMNVIHFYGVKEL